MTTSVQQLTSAAVALIVALNAACANANADEQSASTAAHRGEPPPRELTVVATEYFFRAPDTVAAGLTRVRLVNEGKELHHMQIVRLSDGHSARELFSLTPAQIFKHSWVTPVGGPETTAQSAEVTLRLEPGEYALLCFIPAAGDHLAHYKKGMVRPFVVVPAGAAVGAAAAVEPVADNTMALDDYSFRLERPLHAGRQRLRIRNAAAQPHEVAIVKLAAGKRVEDALAWLRRMDGPPPFAPAGGTMALTSGASTVTTLDLTPGAYVLLCFVPDAKDDKSHVAHGMVKEVTVE